jgi:hypothetical protein
MDSYKKISFKLWPKHSQPINRCCYLITDNITPHLPSNLPTSAQNFVEKNITHRFVSKPLNLRSFWLRIEAKRHIKTVTQFLGMLRNFWNLPSKVKCLENLNLIYFLRSIKSVSNYRNLNVSTGVQKVWIICWVSCTTLVRLNRWQVEHFCWSSLVTWLRGERNNLTCQCATLVKTEVKTSQHGEKAW